jgi:hypothetical protein
MDNFNPEASGDNKRKRDGTFLNYRPLDTSMQYSALLISRQRPFSNYNRRLPGIAYMRWEVSSRFDFDFASRQMQPRRRLVTYK